MILLRLGSKQVCSIIRLLKITKDVHNDTGKRSLIPLGMKKLGVCGRMPGDPGDQIDFTKEGNTIGKSYCRLYVFVDTAIILKLKQTMPKRQIFLL